MDRGKEGWRNVCSYSPNSHRQFKSSFLVVCAPLTLVFCSLIFFFCSSCFPLFLLGSFRCDTIPHRFIISSQEVNGRWIEIFKTWRKRRNIEGRKRRNTEREEEIQFESTFELNFFPSSSEKDSLKNNVTRGRKKIMWEEWTKRRKEIEGRKKLKKVEKRRNWIGNGRTKERNKPQDTWSILSCLLSFILSFDSFSLLIAHFSHSLAPRGKSLLQEVSFALFWGKKGLNCLFSSFFLWSHNWCSLIK